MPTGLRQASELLAHRPREPTCRGVRVASDCCRHLGNLYETTDPSAAGTTHRRALTSYRISPRTTPAADARNLLAEIPLASVACRRGGPPSEAVGHFGAPATS